MYKDWEAPQFFFAGFVVILMSVLLAGAWSTVQDYEMAKIGYVQVVQEVTTSQGLTYTRVWVPRENVEKK